MISRARLKANQVNARRSTGPKTHAGKQRSAKNATKHGFRAKTLDHFLTEQDLQVILNEARAYKDHGVSVSAKKMIFETQAALRSIDTAWDKQMTLLQEGRAGLDHHNITLELNRLSLYAQRIRSLQRKAIDQYLNQTKFQQ